MLYGVKINGADTLQQYGLCLLADYTISSPTIRENKVAIPGRGGYLYMNYSIYGHPIYDNRNISFNLFKRGSTDINPVRSQMATALHGKRVTVEFPFDNEHVYDGILHIGEMEGEKRGIIPISVDASPWKMKKQDTVIECSDLGTSYKSIVLQNEGKPVVPVIECSKETTVQYGEAIYTISQDTIYKNIGITLQAGDNTIKAKVNNAPGTITITYREGVL